MRFDRIDALAFGPLEEAVLELAPGMNVVYGPNEAGKSSWHVALYSGLCGMRRAQGNSKDVQKFTERHRPWDGRRWEVHAVVTLADGRNIELRHDLANKASSVRDTNIAGKDYANEIMHEGAPDGSRWLGLNRRTFLSTACVKQAEILGILDNPAMLQDDIQRAAATAGADSTAAAALQRLENFRRDFVGSNRAPKKPLLQSQAEVRQAQALLSEAEEMHTKYLRRREEVERLEQDVQGTRSNVDAMQAALTEMNVAAAQERLRKIEELGELFPEGAPHLSPERNSLAEKVATALDRWRSIPELIEPEGPTVHEYQQWKEDAERRLAARRAATAEREADEAGARYRRAHELATDFPDGHLPRTVEQERLAERARGALRDFESLHTRSEPTGPTVAEIEAELTDFDAKVNASQPARVRLPWLLACGLAFAIGIVLALALPNYWMLGAGLMAAGVIGGIATFLATRPRAQDQLIVDISRQGILQRLTSRREEERRYEDALRQQDEVRIRLMEIAQESGAHAPDMQSAIEVTRDWLLDWEALLRHRDEMAPKWDELQGLLRGDSLAAIESAAVRLRERAVQLVSSVDEDLLREARVEGIAREQLVDIERETNQDIRNWERQQSDRRNADEQHTKLSKEIAEAEDRLQKAGEEIGIALDNPNDLVTALGEWQERRAQSLGEEKERMDQWGELQNLLAGQSPDEVKDEVDRLKQEAQGRASKIGVGALTNARAQHPTQAKLDELLRKVREAESNHDTASGQLDEYGRTLPSVPDAEEALADAERVRERFTRLDSTLECTIEFLKDAQERVHRDLAPILRSTVLEWLPHVTDRRYVDCRVNPKSLAVDLAGADKRWRNAALLSRGTAEQVYLLLRLALAQHLTREEPCPLILDDAVAACDAQRKEAILDTLLAISESKNVQVILFTHEEDVRDWARNRLTSPAHLIKELDRVPIPP